MDSEGMDLEAILFGDDTMDHHLDDAGDYFATVITEGYPSVTLTPIEDLPEWRRGWTLTLPPQFIDREGLDNMVRALRDDLYWEKNVLIAFDIEQVKDSE